MGVDCDGRHDSPSPRVPRWRPQWPEQPSALLGQRLPAVYQEQAIFHTDQLRSLRGGDSSSSTPRYFETGPRDQSCRAFQLHVTTESLAAGTFNVIVLEEAEPIISEPSSISSVTTISPSVQHYQNSTTHTRATATRTGRFGGLACLPTGEAKDGVPAVPPCPIIRRKGHWQPIRRPYGSRVALGQVLAHRENCRTRTPLDTPNWRWEQPRGKGTHFILDTRCPNSADLIALGHVGEVFMHRVQL